MNIRRLPTPNVQRPDQGKSCKYLPRSQPGLNGPGKFREKAEKATHSPAAIPESACSTLKPHTSPEHDLNKWALLFKGRHPELGRDNISRTYSEKIPNWKQSTKKPSRIPCTKQNRFALLAAKLPPGFLGTMSLPQAFRAF